LPVHFQAIVIASTGNRMLSQQESATSIRVANGILGTQQLFIGGTPQNPGPNNGAAIEFGYPAMVAPGTATVINETRSFPTDTSLGLQVPGGATRSLDCTWHFVL
jgi:hypothetical protein